MALRKKNVAEITERKTSSECCYSVVLATERVAGFRSKATWHKLAFFALVRPADDLLPIRALYGEAGNTNIGLNPLTSDKPIWYAGPDFAASVLLTGRVPEIIEAFRIIPRGMQNGMKKAFIGTRELDPEKHDFFRVVIEERKKLPKSHPHYLLLKIIANALYGIFAELNKQEYGKNRAKQIQIFSGEFCSEERTTIVELPGKFQFPPAAALITAGGRLVLAAPPGKGGSDIIAPFRQTNPRLIRFFPWQTPLRSNAPQTYIQFSRNGSLSSV